MKRFLGGLRRMGAAALLAAAAFLAPASAFATGNISLDGNLSLQAGTATASSGAATLNNKAGAITSESLSTAAGAVYTLTLTDSVVAASDVCFASVAYGTSTTGSPAVSRVTPSAGQLIVLVQNIHASAALNGTIVVSYACFKQ